MKIREHIKNILKNGGLFIIAFLVVIYFILSNLNIANFMRALRHIKLIYILPGLGAMAVVVMCEALNIRRCLIFLEEKVTLRQCIVYSFVGIFFSAVTPAATGGQPMQLYFMCKDKVKASSGVLTLLLDLAGLQFAAVFASTLAYVLYFDYINSTLGRAKPIFLIGIFLNTALCILVIMAVFSKSIIYRLIDGSAWLIGCISKKKADSFAKKALSEVDRYKKGAEILKSKRIIFKSLITNIIRMVSLSSVPFWIYEAFRLKGDSFIKICAMQASLYISGAALPLPGNLGIGEGGFLIFFKHIFPGDLIESGMILSRGISFYMMFTLSGFIVICEYLKRKNRKIS